MAYCEIASTGQVATQAPQSMQVPSSQTDLPSPSIDKAPTGQTPVQAPHPMQVSLLIVTGMKKSSFFVTHNIIPYPTICSSFFKNVNFLIYIFHLNVPIIQKYPFFLLHDTKPYLQAKITLHNPDIFHL